EFHTIVINDSMKTNYTGDAIIETKSMGIVIHTNRGSFRLDEKYNKWMHLPWASSIVQKVGIRDYAWFKDEQYVQTGRNELVIVDHAAQKTVFDFSFPFSITACRLNDDEIIAATYKGKLYRINVD